MRVICVNAKPLLTIAFIVFFCLCFLTLYQNPGYPQDEPNLKPLHPVRAGSPSRLLASAIPSLPTLEELSLRKFKITPFGKFGYQRMGLEVYAPIPFDLSIPQAETYRGGSAYLKVRDVDLWLGEIGLDIQIAPTVRVFMRGTANAPQNLAASMLPEAGGPTGASEWKRYSLDWLILEGGAAFDAGGVASVIGGMRWDRLDVALNERSGAVSTTLGPYRNVNLISADVLSDLWIPYIGIGFTGPSYKASLIGSPILLAEIRIRTRLHADILPSHTFLGDGLVTLTHPGGFVEGNVEYLARPVPATQLSLWGRAGAVTSRGPGETEGNYKTTHPDLKVELVEGQNVIFTRYNLAGGVAFNFSF